MKTIILAIGFFCLGVGIAVLRANPRRFTNQIFALVSLLMAGSQGCVVGAIQAGEAFAQGGSANPIMWLRTIGAVAWMIAALLWLLTDAVTAPPGSHRTVVVRWLPGFMVALILAAISLATDFYVTRDSSPTYPNRGIGYVVFACMLILFYAWLLLRTSRRVREQTGIRRVELQFLSLNLCTAFLLGVVLMVIGNALALPWLKRSVALLYLASYLLAAWAITFHHVFNARQIFLSLGQRVLLILATAAGVAGCWKFFALALPSPADFLLSVGVCISFALWLDQKSREWLRLGSEHAIRDLRRTIILISRTEPDSLRLIEAFEQLLRRECRVESATIVFEWDELKTGSHLHLAPSRPAHATLSELGWATPESLERRWPEPGVTDLREHLAAHALGLLVAAPKGSPAPTMLLALGAKDTRWPFTHPEIECMQHIAELMDNILARSRLVAQAAMRARVEHLAMMSRGLAHDLKNLITPISSYLVHTRGRSEPGSAEEEVHAAARRSVQIMTDYVREAAFFANQLNPRFQAVPLLAIGEAARELVAARAARRGVALEVAIEDHVLIADGVLLQRMLVNLLHNAIDAVAAGDRVTLRGGKGSHLGWVRLQVIDEGCGIPAEHLPRIFEPYFTTKEFGDDVRGFGLGLTICQKIVQLHRGTIGVESSLPQGTTFTVELPLTQPQATLRAADAVVANRR